MFRYIPFCAPYDDTMPGFLSLYPEGHRLEDSLPSRSELAAQLLMPSKMRCLRRRPAAAVFLSLDEPSASKNPRRQESDEDSETELNENCSACRRRRERDMENRRRPQRSADVGGRKSLTTGATTTDEAEKPMSSENDVEAVTAKNIPVQTAENVENQKFVVRLNMNGFDPEQVQVKVKDRVLEIDAKLEEKNKSTGIYTFRELHRRYTLPTNVNPDDVTSFLHSDGYLSSEAPRKPLLNDAALHHKAVSDGEVVEEKNEEVKDQSDEKEAEKKEE